MSAPLSPCSIAVHDTFGPAVDSSCADGFDFTLLFEESILTLAPLGIALGWAILRFWALRNGVAKIRASWLLAAKMALYAIYVILQVALVAVWAGRGIPATRLTVACIVLTIVGFLVLSAVSYLEHMRALRPSTFLSVYLSLTILVDMARVRTLFLLPYGGPIAGIFLASFLIKVAIFAFETCEKRSLLRPDWQNTSPEDLGGFYNRALFVWLNGVFRKGFRTLLTISSLTNLDEEMLKASNPTDLIERWEKAGKSSDHSLVWTFLVHYKWCFFSGVIPRMAYTGFSFSQPYLIEKVLDFTADPGNPDTKNFSYGLVGAYAVVYIGMTLSYAIYQHKTYRLLTLFRGSLVTLIFNKTLRVSSSSIADAEAITLMSADIDRIGSITLVHEFYASFLEAALALYLLYNLLGIAVVAPVAWIVVCLVAGIPLAKAAGNAQTPWLEAIEERLAATSKALNAMKPIKMTGLADIVSSQIATSRLAEIRASLRHRVLNIFVFVAYFASSGLAPVWGFGLFILLAQSRNTGTLTEGTAFAALSAFELLNQPLINAIDGFEHIQTVLNSFRRIQEYLASSSHSSLSQPQEKDEMALSDEKAGAYEKPYGLDSKTAAVVRDATTKYTEEKEPILSGLNFEILRGQTTMIYGPVVQACALNPDLEELTNGDQTHAGIRGSRLSGGQQMRVSFARALYSRNSTMLLDDVLTGLDRATERSILDAVFSSNGLLKQLNATVVLTTNTAHHLQYADYIILLDKNGNIAEQGTPDSVSMNAGGIQALESEVIATSRPELEIPEDVLHELEILDDQEPEETRRAGDMRIYAYYAKTAGYWRTSIYLVACAAFVYGSIFPSVWLQWWTNANAVRPNDRIGYWLGVYGALAAVTMIGCTIADCVFNLAVLPTTARKFHELLLDTTMRAPTSFLTSTNAGTTLNRFSQDLELIDNDLPMAIDQTVFQFLSVIASAVLVFIGSGYVAAAIPLCFVALAVIQFYYLRTSRQLRLLDIEAKAPLFSQFLETLNGIACVRAYGWTHDYMDRNHEALNASQKPFYLLWCIQRWLTLVLDLLNAGIAILLVGVATNVSNGSSAFLGVALFNVIALSSSLQTLITEWTQVETALGAIRRIKSYVATTEDENLPTENGEVPDDWPQQGSITFKDISASYQSSSEPVLREISFSIEAGEKVAICGRTGSGKSSLVAALLRMLEIESGTITIDGIDISTIPRQAVRGRMNTVPQDPFFLHGNVRLNVDPLESVEDERIIEVLRTLNLWHIFEEHEGLDGEVSEETLSHGQRQLFCLARAMVKPGRIVVMDEATSSVDADTDELMQRVLREELKGRTIITIAHKLHTVLDYDRVVLLDKGRIVETGNPQELLKTPASPFRELYERLGSHGE
ncbi:ABC transporter domain-containing protein [Hirsutella rhossiliensis]|uniref:ABC transporter domain-containing protein n=1 Tax=Hirsutella rhossiliensis TaxID=111463 RepID=A0A9P8MVY8_9HYPO|nr:ABC transporter domain-containing protein [Hirsutella rhossiliensis]KAH0960162.1 ABC transporter domain-containing protein [Hirsutella rhossiliensis]